MGGQLQNPGQLAHRVELQERADQPDGLGGNEVNWTTLSYLWARVVPLRQSGGERADHLQGVLTHEVNIRYREDVRDGMRFLHQGRNLRILSCLDIDETRRFLTCLCEEEK
ncbi:MAG: phage head closure protein [Hyphomicrobiales bacterium]